MSLVSLTIIEEEARHTVVNSGWHLRAVAGGLSSHAAKVHAQHELPPFECFHRRTRRLTISRLLRVAKAVDAVAYLQKNTASPHTSQLRAAMRSDVGEAKCVPR